MCCFKDLWVQSGVSMLCLLYTSHKNLLALGENLGYAHKDMQERTLLFYLEETDGSIGFLKREMESRTKLYRCLGMAAGLFLMVVMA